MNLPAVQSRISSSYPSEQSGAPSHKYWIDIQFPSPGHRNGSYGWQASEIKNTKAIKTKHLSWNRIVILNCTIHYIINVSQNNNYVNYVKHRIFDTEDFIPKLTIAYNIVPSMLERSRKLWSKTNIFLYRFSPCLW